MITETKITVKGLISLGFLLLAAILLFIFSYFPQLVEEYYSLGWYPGIGNALRMVSSKLPFSLGDTIYILIFIYLMVTAVQWFWRGRKHGFSSNYLSAMALGFVKMLLWVYILFKLVWGLNYNRMGIAYQLNLNAEPYRKETVTQLTNDLMDSLNACRRQIKDTVLPAPDFADIKKEAYGCYQSLSGSYAFLNYHNRSVKQSLYSSVGDYIGFTGYFNPITGEAQVRSDIPRVMVPYVTCHEIAHQMGYASESEANFVGFLSAVASKDVYFRYSAYLELFSYAQNEEVLLFSKEKNFKAFETLVKHNRAYLDSLVRKDRKEIRLFFQKRQNGLTPAFTSMYDQYLKLNMQAQGIDSYDDVIGWLIAYRKKNGKI